MKKFIAALLILLLAFSITACSAADPANDGNDANTVRIFLTINYPQEPQAKDTETEKAQTQKDLPAPVNSTLTLSEDADILQVLEAYCQQESIQISVENNQVTCINKIPNTQNSTWQYTVNGKEETESPHTKGIHEGDRIVWSFLPIAQK